MSLQVPTVWVAAGSDPSGGAGLQMDLRVLSSLPVHTASVVTAVTAQGLTHFTGMQAVALELLNQQLAALSASPMPRPTALKIGMLGQPGALAAIIAAARALANDRVMIIVDPVLSTSSGGALGPPAVAAEILQHLPSIGLLTPNTIEAGQLLGRSIEHSEQVPEAAADLIKRGAKAVLIKGGHLDEGLVHDYVAGPEGAFWLTAPRLAQRARGTGCALASAIAGGVAMGLSLVDSLLLAKARIHHGLRHAVAVGGQQLLADLASPLAAADMPWLSGDLNAARDRPLFPSCGPKPLGFYPVIDSSDWVRRCLAAGVSTMQLRVKNLQPDDLRQEIKTAIALGKSHGARVFINDHWQLAIELGAYGVHLGQEDLDSCDLNQLAGSGLRLGISTHSYTEACRAHALRPSYIALGPVFATTSKLIPFSPQGLERIAEWHRLYAYPVVAIGGLKRDHAATARRLGADGVACISAITEAGDPDAELRAWLKACV